MAVFGRNISMMCNTACVVSQEVQMNPDIWLFFSPYEFIPI